MKNWESTYRKKGDIKTWISNIVKDSVGLLKKKGVKKILEVGFGTGTDTLFLAENGFDVYGIDISETAKKITEKKAMEKKLKVHLKVADMRAIPFADASFDAVVSVYTLPHNTLVGLRKTFSELKRVLKPKGMLIATLVSTKDTRYGAGKMVEPNTFLILDDPDESDVSHHFSDEKETRELLAGFKIKKLNERSGISKRRNVNSVHWDIIAEKK